MEFNKRWSEEEVKEDLFNILSSIYHFERHLVLTYKLNYQEIYLLKLLKRSSPKKMSEVSAELRIEAFSASRLVARMVVKNLLQRYKAGNDKRNVFISLTPEGEVLVKKIEKKDYEILSGNSKDVKESALAAFFEAAKHIQKIMKV
jgi:DNA-binding MarR family transcriptional regulator